MSSDNFVREQIKAMVAGLEPFDQIEAEHIATTLAWINGGAPLFRTQKPATPPQHLVAYFLLVDLQRKELLLTDHRDAGLWLPSGGHVEPDEHPCQTAAREAEEELGLVANFVWPEPLFLTVTQTQGASAGHTDVSLWYLLQGDSRVKLIHDPGEFHSVKWFAFDDVPQARVEPHLARFMAKLIEKMETAQLAKLL